MPTTDDRTSYLDLPLPHADNTMTVDVARLREALSDIDTKIQSIDNLLASDEVDLDTLQEIVDAIKDDQVTLGTLLTHVGSGGTAHAEATGSVAGFMAASDKVKLDGVSLGAPFDEVYITPGSNGQTSFPVSGGYGVGRILVYVNTFKFKIGTDFTATDGENIVMTEGLTTSDEITVVRFKQSLRA